MTDLEYMQLALKLAWQARYVAPPNPAVGCVLVNATGEVVGQGCTQAVGRAHAEIEALTAADQAGKSVLDATAYVTLEPCSHTGHTGPCADALIQAGITKVVAAGIDPNPRVAGQGFDALRAAGIRVESGLLAEEARAVNPGFFSRFEKGRPYTRVKLASSIDGRTAMASGESVWISSAESRRDVQFLRAASDCILTGSGTVLQDDPALDVRLSSADLNIDTAVRQPLRVVLDSRLRTPVDARLFTTGGDIRFYSGNIITNKYKGLNKKINVVSRFYTEQSEVDLSAMMSDLASLPVNEVHVEAGASLCGALLQASLVDEIVLYLAPHLMGNKGRPQFMLPGLEMMSDRIELEVIELSKLGPDIRVCLRPLA